MSADEPRSPAGDRLDEHLELLRSDVPAGDDALAARIARSARWQGAVRAPLKAAVSLLGAAANGLAALLGVGGRAR
ncbi:MAG TPA: hypothetical protein VEX39_15625 [Thermoleophilaceae bacterium]|nr:hypothetical protein [Thermoleophilaceae bacterium]